MRGFFAWFLAFGVLFHAGAAAAQDGDLLAREPDPGLRLEPWLQLEADRAEFEWTFMTVGGFVAGAGLGFAGTRNILAADDRSNKHWFGAASLLVGALSLTRGTLMLFSEPGEVTRLRRFRLAQQGGLSEREVSRFALELQLTAESSREHRRTMRWLSLAPVLGGAATLTLTALGPPGDRSAGYLVGGAVAGLGALLFLTSFIPREIEEDWDDYERGYRPARDDERVSIRLAPFLSPTAGGLVVAGIF